MYLVEARPITKCSLQKRKEVATMIQTDNLNVDNSTDIPSPKELHELFPATEECLASVVRNRQVIIDILDGRDSRMFVTWGPCAVRTYGESLEVAEFIVDVAPEFPKFLMGMRVATDKPRTSPQAWPGITDDPHMDGSFDMVYGSKLTRQIMVDIAKLGLAVTTEVLGPFTIPKVSDVVSYAWIGARSVANPPDRKLASGLSMPVGFKNADDGSVKKAVEAMGIARHSHIFRGLDHDNGREARIRSKGNPWGHVILRGGSKPNYDADSIAQVNALFELSQCQRRTIMIDTAHGNSGKIPERQRDVALNVIEQRNRGDKSLVGFLIESDLEGGRMDIPTQRPTYPLRKSVTDPCSSIADTYTMLKEMHSLLK